MPLAYSTRSYLDVNLGQRKGICLTMGWQVTAWLREGYGDPYQPDSVIALKLVRTCYRAGFAERYLVGFAHRSGAGIAERNLVGIAERNLVGFADRYLVGFAHRSGAGFTYCYRAGY